jgi:hypothetical protein
VKIFFLEIGHIGYQKIENFMLISKMQTYLSDKMPPKKVKIKKLQKMGLSKFRKQFFNFNFFGGHFVTKKSLLLWNQFKILDFLIPYMTYFKKKKFSPLRRADFKIYQHKNRKKIETPQNKEKMPFLK